MSFHIRETTEQLLDLEGRGGYAERIRMLRLLADDPSMTMSAVAAELGVSERTVRRWWSLYRKGGIAALTERSGSARLTNRDLEALATAIRENGFATIDEITAWISKNLGVDLSAQYVSGLLKKKLKARSVWTIDEKPEGARPTDRRAVEHDKWVAFLNSLSPASDVIEWVRSFQKGLLQLLRDVDRVSVIVNADCDLQNPAEYTSSSVTRRHVSDKQSARSRSRIVLKRKEDDVNDSRISELARQGFPLDDYQTPDIFDYYVEKAFVGSVWLFREKGRSPISQETRDLLGSIEPGIIFLLTDCIARHQHRTPVDAAFNKALTHLGTDAGLSQREREVLILHLMGEPYEQIGEILFISVDTVKKHVKSIHRKTGVKTHTALFAKYFTHLQPPAEVP